MQTAAAAGRRGLVESPLSEERTTSPSVVPVGVGPYLGTPAARRLPAAWTVLAMLAAIQAGSQQALRLKKSLKTLIKEDPRPPTRC